MERERVLKPLPFLIVFIVLFFLSTFAASYRKSVQAAVPVLPPTIHRSISPTSLPPKVPGNQPPLAPATKTKPAVQQSMHKVISALAPELRPKLQKIFASKGVDYPPPALTLIALKKEQRIEVWSPGEAGEEQLILTYPILAASGDLGPKLHQGDLQVPEGFYKVLWFNPESEFYLSLKLNYPNTFDKRMAELDGRTDLGGDIFIHGFDVSLGCLAIGNPAIEEVFLMVYDTGKKNTQVIITPYDFRQKNAPVSAALDEPPWIGMLYNEIREELLFYTKTNKSQENRTG